MDDRSMLDDGQAKSCTSRLLGVALIHTVEAFEDPFLFFFRNSDSGIFHNNLRAA